MSVGRHSRAKRGLGSIIAAAFIVLILISGLTFYTLILRSMDSYNATASEMNQADVNRSREQLTITSVKITGDSKLNLTVVNTGSLSSRLLWLGLFNQSVTPEAQWFFEFNQRLEPAETKTILSDFSVAKDQKYVVQIATAAGNTFTTTFYPASAVQCTLTLVAGAPTVYVGNNITLFLAVTHNDTEVDVIQNITVNLQQSPPGLVTAVEQPTSLTVESLRRGETAFFRWIYTAASTGTVTFNATYNQAPNGTFALATVNIENAPSGSGAGQIAITGVNGSSSFYPSQWSTVGGTQYVSGLISNLKSSDSNPVVFTSYFTGSGTDITDYVDSNTSNVDGSPSRGTHSNFTAQQYGPDSVYDTLTESPLTLTNTYYPSAYGLLGSTQFTSGTITDLQSDNGAYMTFRSYPSATSLQPLYAHSETITIGGSPYYVKRLSGADGAALTLNVSLGTVGRNLLGKFTYPLNGVSSIPAGTWTTYYRAWTDPGFSISFDSSNSTNSGDAVTSLSWLHTTGAASNRFLVVGVSIRTASVNVSSVTYGTQSLTYLRSDSHPGGNIRSELWYLIAPNSGTATITVTLSGSSKIVCGSASYSGVAQTAPIDAQAGGTGTSTAPSQSVTVNTANSWVIGHLATRGSSANVYEGTGQTARWDDYQPSSGSQDSRCRGHGSDKGPVGAGSQSMTWSLSSSTDWAASLIVLKSAAPVASANVDILIRKADGTIRATIATAVANSPALSSVASTLQGTYSWGSYTVESQTDYLEIDYYINVSSAVSGAYAYLRIDDSSLPLSDQTRVANIALPSQYTVSVEFSGTAAPSVLTALTWAIDSHFTTSDVATTFQLYNYDAAAYSTSGDGYMTDTINTTDWTKSQNILTNPNRFMDSGGNWKLKVTGTKATTSPFSWQVDLVQYTTTTNNYVLDLEVQWNNVNFNQTNEWLCIYGGAMDAEPLRVDVWTGSAWQNLLPNLTAGWNNVSVAPYLTSSTFTIRFTGGNETSDPAQSSWNIDVVLLHVWTSTNQQYTVEVEFTGATGTASWTALNWSIQTSWTAPQVSVTIQFYNYSSGSYVTSGAGYFAYTSNPAPNVYELKNQMVTAGASDFVDGAGNWKVKIKGVKDTSSQFNVNVDWLVAGVDYLSSGNTIPYGSWQSYTIKVTSAGGAPIPYSYFSIYANGTSVLLSKNATDPNATISNPGWVQLNAEGEYFFYLRSTSSTSETFVVNVAVGTTLGQKTIVQEAP